MNWKTHANGMGGICNDCINDYHSLVPGGAGNPACLFRHCDWYCAIHGAHPLQGAGVAVVALFVCSVIAFSFTMFMVDIKVELGGK